MKLTVDEGTLSAPLGDLSAAMAQAFVEAIGFALRGYIRKHGPITTDPDNTTPAAAEIWWRIGGRQS